MKRKILLFISIFFLFLMIPSFAQITTYSPSTSTTCNGNICQDTYYVDRMFYNENNTWHPINTTFRYNGTYYIADSNNFKVYVNGRSILIKGENESKVSFTIPFGSPVVYGNSVSYDYYQKTGQIITNLTINLIVTPQSLEKLIIVYDINEKKAWGEYFDNINKTMSKSRFIIGDLKIWYNQWNGTDTWTIVYPANWTPNGGFTIESSWLTTWKNSVNVSPIYVDPTVTYNFTVVNGNKAYGESVNSTTIVGGAVTKTAQPPPFSEVYSARSLNVTAGAYAALSASDTSRANFTSGTANYHPFGVFNFTTKPSTNINWVFVNMTLAELQATDTDCFFYIANWTSGVFEVFNATATTSTDVVGFKNYTTSAAITKIVDSSNRVSLMTSATSDDKEGCAVNHVQVIVSYNSTMTFASFNTNATSNSVPNTMVNFSTTATTNNDDIDMYLFSSNFSDGTWRNTSWASFAGTQTVANLSWANTSTSAGIYGWKFCANTSTNYVNCSDVQVYNFTTKTLNVAWTKYNAQSEINDTTCQFGTPCSFSQYSTFNASGNVSCLTNPAGQSCGSITGGIMYNDTSTTFAYVNVTADATPFYAVGGGVSENVTKNLSSAYYNTTGTNVTNTLMSIDSTYTSLDCSCLSNFDGDCSCSTDYINITYNDTVTYANLLNFAGNSTFDIITSIQISCSGGTSSGFFETGLHNFTSILSPISNKIRCLANLFISGASSFLLTGSWTMNATNAYYESGTAQNPSSIGSLSDGQSYLLNYTVNATGSSGTYNFTFNFSSDNSAVSTNYTPTAFVKIGTSGCTPGSCIYNNSYLQSLNISQSSSKQARMFKTEAQSLSVNQLMGKMRGVLSSISSYFSVSQTIIKLSKFIKSITSSFTLFQLVSRIKVSLNSITSSFTVNQSITRIASFYKSLTSSFILNQLATKIRTFFSSITSSFVINQSASRIGSLFKSITGYFTFNTLSSRILNNLKSLTSYFTISKSISRIRSSFSSLSSYFTISQLSSRLYSSLRSLTSYFTISQNILRLATLYKSLTSYFTITQSVSRLGTLYKFITSYFTLNQSLSSLSKFYQNLLQFLSFLSDLYTNKITAGGKLYNNIATQNMSINQVNTELSNLYKYLAQYFTLSQSIARISSLYKSLTSSLIVSQLSTRTRSVFSYPTSYFTFNQSISRIATLLRFPTSYFTITQSITKLLSSFRSITSYFTINQSISRVLTSIRTISSSFTISQSLLRIANLFRSTISSFTINQSISRFARRVTSLSQSLAFSQSITRLSTLYKSLSQSVTANSITSRILASLRYISGYFTVNLSIIRIQTLLKPISDSLAVSTTITRTLSSLRSITSSFTLNTTISRLGTLIKTVTSYFTINQISSRVYSSLRSITGYITVSQLTSRLSTLLRLPTSSFLFSQSASRIGSLFKSLTSYFTISQLSSRLSSVYKSITGYFTFANSLTRISEFYKSLSSSFTSNAVISRIGTFYKSLTSYFNFSQSLTRLSSFLRFLLQLFGLTAITSSTPSTYNLAITNPTTSNPMIVTSDENITIAFNFTNLTGQSITSGVNVTNIIIGSNGCTVTDIPSYNVTDSLWRVNCTVPTGSGVQDLYLQANATNENILRDNIQSYAIEYSGFRSVIIRLGLILGQSVQRLASMSTSITSFMSINLISSRIYSSLKSITGYFTLNQVYSGFMSLTRTFTSSFSVSQLVYRVLYFERMFSNSILYNSSVRLLDAYNRYITGNFILSGSMSRIAELNKFFGEDISINLIGTRFMLLGRDLTTSLSVTGSFYRLITMTRIFSTGVSISGMISRVQLITYVFSQPFSSIARALGFKPGNTIITTLSLTFSNSVQRTTTFTRLFSEIISINTVLSRTLSLIRMFSAFFGFGGTTYGIRPFICSLQTTESNCAFAGGCYWCIGTCQALTCTQPQPFAPSGGGGGGGWIQPLVTNVTEEKVAFDVDVNIENEQVVPGDKVYATVSLLKYAGPKTVTDINLTYWIENPEGNIVGMKESVIGVEALRRNMYFLAIPIDSGLGLYTFKTIGRYDNFTTVASATFNVVSNLPEVPIISNISVPKAFENVPFNISLSLNNKLDRQLEVNASLILPDIFEPSTIVRNVTLGSLSSYTIDFETKSNETGTFTGFIKIEYNGTKIIKDFPVSVYSTENIYIVSVIQYWWISLSVLLILVILILDIRRLKQKLNKIEKQKSGDEVEKVNEIILKVKDLEKLENELKETEKLRKLIEEEFKDNLILKESYEELKGEYERRISELNAEIEKNKKIVKDISEKQ